MTHPPDWPLVSLGDERYFYVATGGTPDTGHPEYYGGEIRWLKSGDVQGLYIDDVPSRITDLGLAQSNARLHPVGSVVLAMSGRGKTRGTTAVLRVPCTCSQSVAAIVPEPEQVAPEFIHFNLAFRYDELRNLTGSLDRSGLNLNLIRRIEIPLPPLPEQKAIAKALRAVQNAKDARRKELELERQRKAALMEHLFTHGTRNEPTKMTEIGEMPESWELSTVGACVAGGFQNGIYKHSSFYGSGVPIVRIDAFDNYGKFTSFGFQEVQLQPQETTKYRLCENDILINRVNSLSHLGKCVLVPRLPQDTVFESNMMRFRVNSARLLPAYLVRYLVTDPCRSRIRGKARPAVAQCSINQGDVKSLPIPLPPLDEQESMSDAADACAAKVAALERELSLLDELFKAMLEELMNRRLSAVPLVA